MYINYRIKVLIFCKDHNKEFNKTPSEHLDGKGCDECPKITTIKYNPTLAQRKQNFIDKANKKHNNKYTYENVVYINNSKEVFITCHLHGDFEQPPKAHTDGAGCQKCGRIEQAKKMALTPEEFIDRAIEKHGDKYDYSKVVYTNISSNIIIICKKHKKEFPQRAYNHLDGNGCPDCARIPYSKKAIRWLTYLSTKFNTHIQHAENGGEHRIKNSTFKADGYSPEMNAVFEFHGCYFHGCPMCYGIEGSNVICNKQFIELYENSCKKEKFIRSQGYELFVMWEHSWDDREKSMQKG